MILAPTWLAPAERADGEHLLVLRAEGVSTARAEADLYRAYGAERALCILSTLTTERHTVARWVHPAGVEFVGHGYPLAADDHTPGAGEPTTRAQASRTLAGAQPGDGRLHRRAMGAHALPSTRAGDSTALGHVARPCEPKPGTFRRSLPPRRVSDMPRRTRTATVVPGLPGRRPPSSAWHERWQIAAVCAVAVILILQLARGGWT